MNVDAVYIYLFIIMYRTIMANTWYDTTVKYAHKPKYKYKHNTN